MPPRKPVKRASATVRIELAGLFTSEQDDGPKWVQVTREGNFPGYLGGLRPFAFKRADLQAMVDNVHSHPAFKLDDKGVAVGEVIPWDFNHASEQDPTSGELPTGGAPAQAWTLDMAIRDGADGKAQLWALTKFLEPARSYVRAGQYLWASVAVAFNAIAQETGQNIGAIVTSIALTNTPFVEGMEKLAASQRRNAAGEQVDLRMTFYESARTASEAITMMRELFGLPETSGAAEVMVQVGIVMQWLTSGTAPLGTDPEYIVGSMRKILNLPTLTADLEVLQEAGKSIQRLLEEQAVASGVTAPNSATNDGTVPSPNVAASRQKKENEVMEELIKILASLLGVRQSQEAVTDAVKEAVALRNGLKSVFKLERDGIDVLLGAAKDSTEAKSKLMGLFTALGVEDPNAAVAKVAQVMQSAAQLKEVMPELEGLRADKAKTEEASQESDVDSAIAASKLHPSVKPALLLYRKQNPVEFAKTYPKVATTKVDAHKQLLQQNVANGGVKLNADGSTVVLNQAETINLSMYPGANPTARAKAYLASTVTNWDKLTNEDQHIRAVNLRKQTNVVDQAVS